MSRDEVSNTEQKKPSAYDKYDKPKDIPEEKKDSKLEEEEEELVIEFIPFTTETWKKQCEDEERNRIKAEERKERAGEAHLIDGELRFETGVDPDADKERNSELKEGCVVPEWVDEISKELCSVPLQEIDRNIKDKTFVIIATRFRKKYIYRFSSTPSFMVFYPWNILRRLAAYLATNQYFDVFIIITILTNCVFLAMPNLEAANTAEYVFLAIYAFEMIIKLIARGFFVNSYTYLRDPWNWLDFIVIVMAFITVILENALGSSGLGNLQGVRTFRVFRVLRTVSIVPGLKTIVNALLRAFRLLIEVIILIMFCLMVFALFALQVYVGIMRQKCVKKVPQFNATESYSYAQYYNDFIKNTSNWYHGDGTDYLICGNVSGTRSCPTDYICLPNIGENPNYGYTSFDHFGWALLTSFQLVTLDFWEDTYSKVLQALGPWNVLFFILVVFFGAFYLINLMLAVVALSYEEEAVNAGKEKEKDARNKEKKARKMAKKAKEKMHGALKKLNIDVKDQKKQQSIDLRLSTDNVNKHNETNSKTQTMKRNPMIKMASKDSGTGNSLESHPSSRSTDNDEESNVGSVDSGIKKGPGTPIMSSLLTNPRLAMLRSQLKKQESAGMVSSSGIMLDKNSVEDQNEKPPEITSEETLRDRYPGVTIITVKELSDISPKTGELINRNCICCADCCGGRLFLGWLKFQGYVNWFISDPLFDLFVTICIVLNTVFMALEHHGMSDALSKTLDISNYIFTSVFTVEMVSKLIVHTKHFFKNGWNIFDAIIVIASLIDMGVEDVDGLSVFRTFRLLRVFKLAQSWPTMRLLLSIIMSTLGALGNLTVILCIMIYIFAVIGLQLFSDKYTEDVFGTDLPRWHFKDIFHSFMMIFRTLCGEWIEPLWDCMRASNELCMAVFLPTLVLGNFIILNLFLALLLNAFESDTLRKAKEDNNDDNKLKLAFYRIRDLCCCCCLCCFRGKNRANSVVPDDCNKNAGDEEEKITQTVSNKDTVAEIKEMSSENATVVIETEPKSQPNGIIRKSKNIDQAFDTKRDQFSNFHEARKASQKAGDSKSEKSDIKSVKSHGKKSVDDNLALGEEASTMKDSVSSTNTEKENVMEDCLPHFMTKKCKCLEIFNETSFGLKWIGFRKFLLKVVTHKVFEGIVLICIFISSLTLALDDVFLYSNTKLKDALTYLDMIFTILFTIEMILKVFAFGLKKYFTSFWTILDCIIVAISWASLIADYTSGGSNLSAFRAMRTLRALRPLRAISRWQGMKIVVNALMMAIPAIFNVLLVCVVFWLIFSIMGVQFFKGKFYKCVDSSGTKLSASVVANKEQCQNNSNYQWINSDINFDNVGSGYLALFQVATFEGWMEVMEDATDSTDVDMQPSREAGLYYYLYFVAFIIFGSFFTLNLFIGVIIDNFNMLKKKYDGSYLDMFLTDSQRQYYNTLKKLGNKKPTKTIRKPKNKIQCIFYDVAQSSKFEVCIILIIFGNMIVMAVEHYNQTQSVSDALDIMNILFVTIFTLEAIVKIIGLRWHYFRQPWNVFDIIIVLLSIMGIILDDLLSNAIVSPTILRVVRIFRIGRILRLIRAAKGIRKLLFALIISLPALINVGALLALVMYIYSIIAMSSFGDLKITGTMDIDIVNFRTFPNSFLLLFRLSTSAGWNDILGPMLITPPECNNTHYQRTDGVWEEQDNGECGTPWLAVLFMVSYVIIIFLVVINMYIAIILENFNQAHEQEEVGITEDDFDMFYVVWERFDPLATQYIKYEQLSNFVSSLDQPLGIPKPNEIALVSFNLRIMEGDKLHCLDVLMSLVKYVVGNVDETDYLKQLQTQMERRFQEAFPTRVNTKSISTTMQRKKEDVAAKTLQRAWRGWKTAKQLKDITTMALQQNMIKNAQSGRSKSGIYDLGRRLSSALSNFFSSSRPNSAVSRLSAHPMENGEEPRPQTSTKKKASSMLEVPKVTTLYSDGILHNKDMDFEL
ncbi:hypothetical protein CHS0354_013028 [Potamilus streckersoni]|uniref:Sodium channel protein n=1 Tax=Potamilus streckersoni TaxID=2493646 RepID=A0AAE0SZ95_9BIVA|nr:hypothetical protein CHS0354_013028 [Potamilus streckersoni]